MVRENERGDKIKLWKLENRWTVVSDFADLKRLSNQRGKPRTA